MASSATDPFEREVRDYLKDYLEREDITPRTLERLMARLAAVTLRERGTEALATGIQAGMQKIMNRVSRGKR